MTFYTLVYFVTSKSCNFKYCVNTQNFIASLSKYLLNISAGRLTIESLCHRIIRGEKGNGDGVHQDAGDVEMIYWTLSELVWKQAGCCVSQIGRQVFSLAYVIFCAIENKINKAKPRVWSICQLHYDKL